MNTEKVFVAYSKDGEELLLYRKDNNTYINLLNRKNSIYPIENIDLSTLVFASNSLELKKHMCRAFIKKEYKKDREQLLDTSKIIIGDKVKVTNLDQKLVDEVLIYKCSWNPVFQYKTLFICTGNKTLHIKKYKDLSDLNDKNEYMYLDEYLKKPELLYIPELNNGLEIVKLSDHTLKSIYNQAYLDKKSVHETAYHIKKKSLQKNERGK